MIFCVCQWFERLSQPQIMMSSWYFWFVSHNLLVFAIVKATHLCQKSYKNEEICSNHTDCRTLVEHFVLVVSSVAGTIMGTGGGRRRRRRYWNQKCFPSSEESEFWACWGYWDWSWQGSSLSSPSSMTDWSEDDWETTMEWFSFTHDLFLFLLWTYSFESAQNRKEEIAQKKTVFLSQDFFVSFLGNIL